MKLLVLLLLIPLTAFADRWSIREARGSGVHFYCYGYAGGTYARKLSGPDPDAAALETCLNEAAGYDQMVIWDGKNRQTSMTLHRERQPLRLRWLPSNEYTDGSLLRPAGYKVYLNADGKTCSVDVGNVTDVLINFAGTAYDSAGQESDLSNLEGNF